MSGELFKYIIIVTMIVGLWGIIQVIMGFLYQYRLFHYLMKNKQGKVRKLSRLYNPINSINFLIYVFTEEDSEDINIRTYKQKLRNFLIMFILAMIIFGFLIFVLNKMQA